MSDKSKAELARRIYDESDGTVEDMAQLMALQCHMTKAECEAFIELAVKLQIEKILDGE